MMTPERRLLVQQFARFGTVGVAGAAVDIATVYAAMAELGLYLSGLLAYFAAVTTTWALNRAWTFAGRGSGGLLRQWLLFVAANGVGFVLNRGTFALLVTLLPVCAQHPVIAILAGVGAGMFANFNLSRSVVFRAPRVPALTAQPATAEATARVAAGATTRVAAGAPE
jgi:putative flippase GtrA